MKVKQKRQITIIQFMEILSAVGQRMPEEVMVAFWHWICWVLKDKQPEHLYSWGTITEGVGSSNWGPLCEVVAVTSRHVPHWERSGLPPSLLYTNNVAHTGSPWNIQTRWLPPPAVALVIEVGTSHDVVISASNTLVHRTTWQYAVAFYNPRLWASLCFTHHTLTLKQKSTFFCVLF